VVPRTSFSSLGFATFGKGRKNTEG
jgi:hypothetical protein